MKTLVVAVLWIALVAALVLEAQAMLEGRIMDAVRTAIIAAGLVCAIPVVKAER